MSKFSFSQGRKRLLRGGVSLVALVGVGALGAAAPAFAQDKAAATDTVDEVVVIGVRQSLATSQQIKKNADTVVDSITATDIGAFPTSRSPRRCSACRASRCPACSPATTARTSRPSRPGC